MINDSSDCYKVFLQYNAFKCHALYLQMFNINLSSKALSTFFSELVLGTIRQREEQRLLRNDMIQLLMEAKKGITFKQLIRRRFY